MAPSFRAVLLATILACSFALMERALGPEPVGSVNEGRR